MNASSKRGVSPLIATILLIAFAVALGSVIMNWGLSLRLNSNDPCQRVAMELKKFENGEVCYGNHGSEGYINFILQNHGTSDIAGVSVWLSGQKKTEIVDLNSLSIPRNMIFEKIGNERIFDFSQVGNLDQIQFIPKVMVNGKLEACTKQAVQPKGITFC